MFGSLDLSWGVRAPVGVIGQEGPNGLDVLDVGTGDGG